MEQRHQRYVLAVASNTYAWSGFKQVTAGQALAQVKEQDRKRVSAGAGSKGPRLYDWARVRINSHTGMLSRWLLFRRSLTDAEDVAHYLVHAPANTSLETMVRAVGSRCGLARWRDPRVGADGRGLPERAPPHPAVGVAGARHRAQGRA